MTTEEKIEVMKAYAEGKKIEWKPKGCQGWDEWIYHDDPSWNWDELDFRIKPEFTYRPYKDSDEMVEDFKRRAEIATNEMFLPMIYIKSKNNGCRILLNTFGAVSVDGILFCDLLDRYTFLDGSPCGIREEKEK